MTLLNAEHEKKDVDAEKKIGTTNEESFDAIKEVVPDQGDQVESNAKFKLGKASTQKEKSAS
eukprot:4750566-Karenia_brevis.AAC.1